MARSPCSNGSSIRCQGLAGLSGRVIAFTLPTEARLLVLGAQRTAPLVLQQPAVDPFGNHRDFVVGDLGSVRRHVWFFLVRDQLVQVAAGPVAGFQHRAATAPLQRGVEVRQVEVATAFVAVVATGECSAQNWLYLIVVSDLVRPSLPNTLAPPAANNVNDDASTPPRQSHRQANLFRLIMGTSWLSREPLGRSLKTPKRVAHPVSV